MNFCDKLTFYTDYSIQTGQNCIIIVAGANLLLSEKDIHNAEDMIAKAKVMVCQLEVKPEVTLEALKIARKHGGGTMTESRML